MAVDTFDPKQFDPSSAQSLIDEGLVARAVACALAQSGVRQTSDSRGCRGPCTVGGSWGVARCGPVPSESLVALIRLFT